MRKFILFTSIIVILLLMVHNQTVRSKDHLQTIPDDAIRLRILANSDTEEDQRIKNIVRDEVNEYITERVQYIDDIKVGREVIANSIPEVERIVRQTLQREHVTISFTVEYKEDVTFPMKIYDNYVYPAGEYEAVLITIGEGKGANWWCVLFPPLCFLDFANGSTVEEEQAIEERSDADENNEAEETDETEVEVKFFLLKWFGL